MPVEVSGLNETLKALSQFEPDLAKNLSRQVRAALTPVQKKAQGYAPNNIPGLSQWNITQTGYKINARTSAFAQVGRFPKYNASIVRRGIRIFLGATRPNSNGFIAQYRISNMTASGAILETAAVAQPWDRKAKGHKFSHSINPNAGKHFVEALGGNLEGYGNKKGRVLYRAWNEDEGKALTTTLKAVDMTVEQFTQRANAQVFRNLK